MHTVKHISKIYKYAVVISTEVKQMVIGRKVAVGLLVAVIFLVPISAVTNEITEHPANEKTVLDPVPHAIDGLLETNDDPEIVDETGDARFDYIDVLWASFYEHPDEPEYLFADMKIADLEDAIGCVYAIHWYCNEVHYYVSIRNGVLFPPHEFKSWQCGFHWLRAAIDTWDESLNSGSFDLEANTISWKIHKSCIDDPQPGDILTRSYVFTAQRLSRLGLIPFRHLFESFSDSTSSLESTDYVIQY